MRKKEVHEILAQDPIVRTARLDKCQLIVYNQSDMSNQNDMDTVSMKGVGYHNAESLVA